VFRASCVGPLGELVTGNQGDAPCVKRWMIRDDGVENIGDPIYHDHWVTALTARQPGQHPCFPEGCIVSGCMDTGIRVYDSIGNPILLLEGHAKGVISLSWSSSGQLLSGSWDGTARVWEFAVSGPEDGNTLRGNCVNVLGGHENGVNVIGFPNGRIVTTSTGESVNDKPANFKVRIFEAGAATPSKVLQNHEGSIRSITWVPGIDGFTTSSNDGSLCLHTMDGSTIGQMVHNPQEDGSLPFVLQWYYFNFSMLLRVTFVIDLFCVYIIVAPLAI
jgi:phospholipase A-2-activating protein